MVLLPIFGIANFNILYWHSFFALNRNYERDIAGVPDTALILVGTDDEALKAEAFVDLFDGTGAEIELVDGVDHFGIVLNESAITRLNSWLSEQ